MTDLLVKICGVTRDEDARKAVALGAQAIGFIFWPRSPRYVAPAVARAIARRLPAFVTPVGVFVNESADSIERIACEVGLGAIQLHGDETPTFAHALDRPIIRALSGDALPVGADAWPPAVTVLIDAHDPVQRGGTGRTVDWAMAAQVAARRRVLLSGGLTPANVSAAVRAVRPFGVDVSSGVEAAPGVKDHAKLTAFFAQVRGGAVVTGETEVSR